MDDARAPKRCNNHADVRDAGPRAQPHAAKRPETRESRPLGKAVQPRCSTMERQRSVSTRDPCPHMCLPSCGCRMGELAEVLTTDKFEQAFPNYTPYLEYSLHLPLRALFHTFEPPTLKSRPILQDNRVHLPYQYARTNPLRRHLNSDLSSPAGGYHLFRQEL